MFEIQTNLLILNCFITKTGIDAAEMWRSEVGVLTMTPRKLGASAVSPKESFDCSGTTAASARPRLPGQPTPRSCT